MMDFRERLPLKGGGRMGAWTLALAAMLLVLLAPALWNGFPLIFPDTGGYLARPFDRDLEMGRSALYGAFLAAGMRLDFWPNVIAQAGLAVWLILLTLRAHGLGGRALLAFGVVILLAAGTSLPWYAGQLMPDIFFPAAVLSLHLLAFRGEGLRALERAGLAGVIVFAIPIHMAILGLCLGIVAALLLLSHIRALALPRPRLRIAGAAVAAGIALCPLSNLAVTGNFAFTPGGTSFLFGRLIQDGIVGRYLADACPDESIKLCAFRGQLPPTADDWLWGDTPFYKLGGWQDYEPEERRIILATLRHYPVEHITTAAKAALDQFIAVRTGEGINPLDTGHTEWIFQRLIPDVLPRLQVAPQQQHLFGFTLINRIQVPFALLCVAALGIIVVLGRHRVAPQVRALALSVLLALAGNALICGVFSNPNDRYQSRLVWLAPFALIVAMLVWRRDGVSRTQRDVAAR